MERFDKYHCVLVREDTAVYEKTLCSSPENAAEAARALGYEDFAEEKLGMFCLDAKGAIIGYHEISHGTLRFSLASPREIFKRALLNNAAAIVLLHNHPSGDPTPSEEDKKMTERLRKGANLLDIALTDHIIIGEDGEYFSMNKAGCL